MTTKTPDHDLDHEVYIDPKDHKEHVNHGMIEYTEADLRMKVRLMIGIQGMRISIQKYIVITIPIHQSVGYTTINN